MVDSISERVSLMVCNLIDTSDSVVDTIAAVDASVAVVEDVFEEFELTICNQNQL